MKIRYLTDHPEPRLVVNGKEGPPSRAIRYEVTINGEVEDYSGLMRFLVNRVPKPLRVAFISACVKRDAFDLCLYGNPEEWIEELPTLEAMTPNAQSSRTWSFTQSVRLAADKKWNRTVKQPYDELRLMFRVPHMENWAYYAVKDFAELAYQMGKEHPEKVLLALQLYAEIERVNSPTGVLNTLYFMGASEATLERAAAQISSVTRAQIEEVSIEQEPACAAVSQHG